jgi:histidine ammonia-lyase
MMRQIGSLGIGDLQPQAQMGLCLVGVAEGELKHRGQVGPADRILAGAGVEPVSFPLGRMEALAVITGGTVLLAVALAAYHRARKLLALAEGALALSMDAMLDQGDLFAIVIRSS